MNQEWVISLNSFCEWQKNLICFSLLLHWGTKNKNDPVLLGWVCCLLMFWSHESICFTHFHTQATQPLWQLSCCCPPCLSTCRTRTSSINRLQAKLRPRTSSRQQSSRPLPSRTHPRPMALLEQQGAPQAGVYNMVKTRGLPTRNLGSGPLGPPQALVCYSQSTR